MTSASKSVAELHNIEVDAETGGSVQTGIGEVLEPESGIGVGKWIDANTNGCDDLNRTSEILVAEFVVAEKSRACSSVEGEKSVPAA